MVQIQEPEVNMTTLREWYTAKKQLAAVKASEMLLRTRIFKHFFPNAKEGSGNWVDMPDGSGYRLNAERTITRNLDEPIVRSMWDQFVAAGINMNELIRMKPELNTKAYRELTEEQRKFFDQALTIKDGSPSLDIKPPKGK